MDDINNFGDQFISIGSKHYFVTSDCVEINNGYYCLAFIVKEPVDDKEVILKLRMKDGKREGYEYNGEDSQKIKDKISDLYKGKSYQDIYNELVERDLKNKMNK